MTGKSRPLLLLPFLLILHILPLWGQTSWTFRTDWEKATLSLNLARAVPRDGINLPAANLAAEAQLSRELPALFTQAASSILLDSQKSIGDMLGENPALGRAILGAAPLGRRDLPRYSRDLGQIQLTYNFPLYDLLGALFVTEQEPEGPPTIRGWRSTKDFTGLVIYAKGELPLHGEEGAAGLQPCLFPKIFDSQMNPVLLTSMGKPEYLRKWGSAAYTSSFDEGPWQDRIGKDPFRVIATGLFGNHRTDLKIPQVDAESFLKSPSARRILSEGRVLIICDLD